MRGLALLVCAAVAGCATAPPTVEEINAKRAAFIAACNEKGYKPNTQDFQTCLHWQMQVDAQEAEKNAAAGRFAASMGIVALSVLSDERAKRDIEPVGTLQNGIRLYRFRYLHDDQLYVGVIAQEVEQVVPAAVVHGNEGLLRVNYRMLGIDLMRWEQWKASRI